MDLDLLASKVYVLYAIFEGEICHYKLRSTKLNNNSYINLFNSIV